MAKMVANDVFGSFVMENGSFDLNGLDTLIADLRTLAKDKRAKMKDILAKEKEANKAVAAEAGKEYYNSLKVGDQFEILISGKATLVKKIETKSKSSNSAACAIVEWSSDMGKTPNRYLGFDKVIVPQNDEEEIVEDEIVEDEIEEPTLD